MFVFDSNNIQIRRNRAEENISWRNSYSVNKSKCFSINVIECRRQKNVMFLLEGTVSIKGIIRDIDNFLY